MDLSGWRTDAGSLTAFLVPGVFVPLLLLVLAFWQPTRRQVRRWGAVCDVVITDGNEEQVRSHLGRGRRFRSVAAFPFWWLMGIRVVYADFPAALASPYPAIAAYVGAALFAEATSTTATAPVAVRHATLLARSMADYVPRWTRVLPWALIVLGAAATVLGRHVDSSTSTRQAAVVVVAAAAFTAAAEMVGHRLVRRPQRGSDPDVLAADDGLRAAGVSTAQAAAGLAGVAAAWTGVAAGTPVATGAWVLAFAPPSMTAMGLAIGFLCCIVRQETWGYRRRHRQPAWVAVSA